MGKVVEKEKEKKKKKKGRPSLLDLQRRNLKEQQEQKQQLNQNHNHKKKNLESNRVNFSAANSNPNYSSAAPLRRSTRRNPNDGSVDDLEDGEFNDELTDNRRERKLKLVVRLNSEKSPVNSSSLNSCNSGSNADGDDNVGSNNKKRKIVSIVEGSRFRDSEKGEKSISATNPTETLQEEHMDSGPSTPLPDKKLLVFILDRIQKKDIYGVFSEPVDPNELPDYHEIIEHPMDFGTVREKLASGAYTNLEQFEKDVFLISSNAMQYNSPDTIYFRQARTILELAKKNFKDLRQDSDDDEPGPKVVRRGRPPTKNLKKPLGRPSLERAGSDFSPDATLATSGENTNRSNYESRKGPHQLEKPSLADLSGRLPISNNDATFNLFTHNRFDRGDDFTGSVLRINSVKQGKKQIVTDENRRNTYKEFQTATNLLEPSVLNTFDRERKLLLPVGLFMEHAYARSLTRFAADLGSVAWRVASKKVERSLPAGVSFGHGWVGEDDTTQKRVFLPQVGPDQMSTLQPSLGLENSTSVAKPLTPELKGGKLSDNSETNTSSDKHDPSHDSSLDVHPTKPLNELAAASLSPFTARQSSEPCREQPEATEGLNSSSDYNVLESSIPICPRPSFQKFQSPIARPGMNGYNGAYGFDLSAHKGKLIEASEPAGVKLQSPQILHKVPRTNANFILPGTMTSLNPKESKCHEDPLPSTINSGSSMLESGNEALVNPAMGIHSRTHWQGLSVSPQERTEAVVTTQYKPESVPPDLNLRFKSPGSPSSSKVDSAHPDLVLQL